MKLQKLKATGILDEFQHVILIDFDGKHDAVLERGYFGEITNKYDECECTVSTLSSSRREKFRVANSLGIFIEL